MTRSIRWLWLPLLLVAACQSAPPPTPTFEPPPHPPPASPTLAVPSPLPSPYPEPATATPRPAPPTAVATPNTGATPAGLVYIPFLPGPTAPPPTPVPPPTPTPTIDFAAVRANLQAQGQDLAFSKIGFHTGAGGNMTGIGTWMRRLDAAGVPFFLKSADNAGPLFEAQEIARASGVPHTLVYRASGDAYDTPDYDLPPAEAAERHWALHKAAWPPELDPALVWIETINEVDKARSAWLGEFALHTAELTLADGYRWAAFGWSSGEPEVSDWERPSMLAFLRLAAAHPDRLAIALHEYSFIVDDIAHQYPFKIGRFLSLFDVADRAGIPRPTVLITEWGWEYRDVPDPARAMGDIAWAAELYAPFPEIRGAAIWYLGGFFDDIDDETQKLIAPLTEFNLGTYFTVPLLPARATTDPAQFLP